MRLAEVVRPGVRVGVDVGSVRVGVAASDPSGVLASPVTVLQRRRDAVDVDELVAEITSRDAIEVVIGLPVGLADREGAAAAAARDYAAAVAARGAPVPVRLVDERLSTVQAQRGMHAAGHTTKSARGAIDAAAAAVILQQALDTERATGDPPGELVTA
jgi:putative Holliday junction resolvase